MTDIPIVGVFPDGEKLVFVVVCEALANLKAIVFIDVYCGLLLPDWVIR